MKNIKKPLFVLVSVLALTGCGSINTNITSNTNATNPDFNDVGVVKTPEKQLAVKELYNDAIDTTQELEEISEEDSTTSSETTETPSTEVEETPSEGEEPTEEEPSESEEETPVEEEKEEILSYHVDYTYEYAMKASIGGFEVVDQEEKETYSLTCIKEGENTFLRLDMEHQYRESDYYEGSEKTSLIYQDGILYVSQDISYGRWGSYTQKSSYEIKNNRLYREFNDYFRYMYTCTMLDPTSRESTNTLLDTLLAAEDVEITNVDGDNVTVQFNFNEGIATMVFDSSNKTFSHVEFDYSKVKDEISSEEIEEKIEEEDEEEVETPEIETPDHHEPGEGHNEPPHDEWEDDWDDHYNDAYHGYISKAFTIDEYKDKLTIDFDYSDQQAKKLTDEEKETYFSMRHQYTHVNDRSYYEEKGYQEKDDRRHHGR